MFGNIDALCVAARNRECVDLFLEIQGSFTKVVLGKGADGTCGGLW